MSKPFIKKKFKYDVESESETELLRQHPSEDTSAQLVSVRYLCDSFDFETVVAVVEADDPAPAVTAPKCAHQQRDPRATLRR